MCSVKSLLGLLLETLIEVRAACGVAKLMGCHRESLEASAGTEKLWERGQR